MAGRVLFFGKLCDAAGASETAYPPHWDGKSVAEIRSDAAALWPGLADVLQAPGVRIAVDQEIVQDETAMRLTGDEEVAFMPPLSGG